MTPTREELLALAERVEALRGEPINPAKGV